jgi:gamma-tubulin complex component 3
MELPKTTIQMVGRLLKMGWVFRQIKKQLTSPQGLYQQSFISSIQDEIQEYYRLLAILESQVDRKNVDGQFTSEQLSLKRLYVWIGEPLIKMRLILSLLETCKSCKGGQIISAVHKYAEHGDPLVHEFVQRLLKKLTSPFYNMVHDWIYQGELQDPYNEFFIAQNDDTDMESQWKSKFSLRESMLPTYIPYVLAKKVFLIGKSLNFIRHCCNDSEFPIFHHQQKQQLEYGDLKKLEVSIDKAYRNSSKHLLTLLIDKFNLLNHLQAIKKYILLSQGDFVQYLMDSLGSTLSKPATGIYRHNLTGTLESAIRASNAQYDHPEILKRLDVRLLEASGGETGWDIFVLDYHTDAPCNTVLTGTLMHQYHCIFAFLWKIKRVEHCLSRTWQAHSRMVQHHRKGDLRSHFHKSQLILGEMVHFVNQLQRFVFYEVIECAWNDLMQVVEQDSCDLDTLIEAHEKFVERIMQKGLLSSSPTTITAITKIFQSIYKFSDTHVR